MGGNQTTVTVVALAGAASTLLLALLHYFFAAFMTSAGTVADGAIQTLVMGLVCYYAPVLGHPDNVLSLTLQSPPTQEGTSNGKA